MSDQPVRTRWPLWIVILCLIVAVVVLGLYASCSHGGSKIVSGSSATSAAATPNKPAAHGDSSPVDANPPPAASQLDIDGTYLEHGLTNSCMAPDDHTVTITHQGDRLTISGSRVTYTGTLKADQSFTATGKVGPWVFTERGVFASEGGRTVIRDGAWDINDDCHGTFAATKQ